MRRPLILLSIPGLRRQDLAHMPALQRLAPHVAELRPSLPALTCPVQANMTTGVGPERHGVIANGFFYRDRGEVEMWTAWNDCIASPQVWSQLKQSHPDVSTAVWFPLHSKGCTADFVCTPAPIHNPDGSESLWCYTRPEAMYGELRDALGHFPLHHFWGPLTSIASTAWIADSFVTLARRERPDFAYIYLPHLDYEAQRHGPDSPAALAALTELDGVLERLARECHASYGQEPAWLAASEYAIQAVDHVTHPNRVLRELGLLTLDASSGTEQLDVSQSAAWVLVDHQIGHVFVRDGDPAVAQRIAERFRREPGIARVLMGDERATVGLHHPRSGDVVLLSESNSWQAYYWWLDDTLAPPYARTVDIHRKPGYDPVELFFDRAAKCIPLDATLVKGSHGVLTDGPKPTILASNASSLVAAESYADTDVCELVRRHFSLES